MLLLLYSICFLFFHTIIKSSLHSNPIVHFLCLKHANSSLKRKRMRALKIKLCVTINVCSRVRRIHKLVWKSSLAARCCFFNCWCCCCSLSTSLSFFLLSSFFSFSSPSLYFMTFMYIVCIYLGLTWLRSQRKVVLNGRIYHVFEIEYTWRTG